MDETDYDAWFLCVRMYVYTHIMRNTKITLRHTQIKEVPDQQVQSDQDRLIVDIHIFYNNH